MVQTEHPPAGDTVGSVVSPSEVRHFAGLPERGMPEPGDAAAMAGRRLARHPLLTPRGPGGEQEWLTGVQLLLAPLGIQLQLLKMREGGAVLRCTAAAAVPGATACDLSKASLELLPVSTGTGHATVVETTCMKRGADACLYMLLWDGGARPADRASSTAAILPASADAPASEPARPVAGGPMGDRGTDGERSGVPTANANGHAGRISVTANANGHAGRASVTATTNGHAGRASTPAPAPTPRASANGHRPSSRHGTDAATMQPASTGHPWPNGNGLQDQLAPAPRPMPSTNGTRRGGTALEHRTTLPAVDDPRSPVRAGGSRSAILPSDGRGSGWRTGTSWLPDVPRLRLPGVRHRETPSRRAPWLRRRAWVLVLAALAGAVGGLWVGNHKSVSYSAQATLIVQSGSGRNGPGPANDANALAVTYSALIPTDARILDNAARRLAVSPSDVSNHLSVSVETGTSLMHLDYTASTPQAAQQGARTVARLAAGSAPPTSAIPGGSLVLVTLPTSASIAGKLHKDGLPLGVVLGLAVGAILVIAIERADPRIDGADQLGDACDCPATSLPDGMSAVEIAHAVSRVVGPSSQVTVVPLAAADAGVAGALARSLATERASDGPAFEAGPPFETGSDELAAGSGPTVLVTKYGVPRRRVQAAVERLRLLGRDPLWAALADPKVGEPEIPSRAS